MNAIINNFTGKGQGSVRLDLTYQPGIALITIDNPKRHNALSGKMIVEFYRVITQLEQSTQDLVAVIFMGGGLKSFCAGLDLSFAREYLTNPGNPMSLNKLMYDAIDRLTKLPLITLGIPIGGSIGGLILCVFRSNPDLFILYKHVWESVLRGVVWPD